MDSNWSITLQEDKESIYNYSPSHIIFKSYSIGDAFPFKYE